MAKSVFKRLVFLFLISALAGCTGGGGDVTGSGSGAAGGSISVSKVYPTASGAGWTPIFQAGTYYIKGLSISITGTCARGIATVSVTDGVITQGATCTGLGTYTWNFTYTSGQVDGALPGSENRTLTLTGLDINSNPVSGATATVNARIDDVVPTAPVVTNPVSTPYQYTGSVASYLIQGTASTDTVTMKGPGGVTITPDAGHNWSYTASLTQGSTLSFTFYSYDLAGNQSVGTTQTITWAPSATMRIAGPFQGGPVTDGVTNYSMESSGFIDNGFSTDGVTSYTLLTGFNFVTNQVRADPW